VSPDKTRIGGTGVTSGVSEITELTVRSIIKKEFEDALEHSILPKLEEILKGMLGQVKSPLTQINKALFEKLASDEQRHENMIKYYQ
jgi:hypothetical protein